MTISKLGRYQLRRVLGRGAMGVVYEGFDPTLGRRVAVKTILRSAAIDAETERAYSARFVQEAKAVARLNHPHIVQVHDFGEENEVAFLVMEFIQGRELRSFFDAGEKFELAEVVRIMGELLDALEFAHEAGVVHRDVKPANVMLDARRRAKLTDFGVARVQDSDRSAAGTMVGTPAFMSPEQISGGKIDRRTDIFSAGVVLYQLLTGEQPFTGEGAWTVARQIMQDDPPRPSTRARSVSPAAFDTIVARALAKSPAQRYASAKEFAGALRAAAAGGQAEPASAVVMPESKPKAAPPAGEAEVEFWRSIQSSNDAAELEVYLEQYPGGTYAQLARVKIGKLREAKRSGAQATLRSDAEARARQSAVDEDATVAIGAWQPAAAAPEPARSSKALPAAIALAVAAAIGVYLYTARRPAPEPVTEVPAPAPAPAPTPAPKSPPELTAADIERTRKETEERVRREYSDKSAAEQAAAAKAAADKAILEKQLAAKAAAEKAAADKATAEKARVEQLAAAKQTIEKVTTEKAAAERAAAEKAATEKAALEKAAAEKAAAEKAAAAKAAAAKPGWPGVGDRWIYQVREINSPEKKYQATFEVQSVAAAAITESFSISGKPVIELRHGPGVQLVGVAPGLAVFAPFLRAFGNIQQGMSWSNVAHRGLWACEIYAMLSCSVSARVAAKERVKVPAGSFDAWKIEVELAQSAATYPANTGYNKGGVLLTYWYSEEARHFVRFQARALEMWSQPELEAELLSYVPAGSR